MFPFDGEPASSLDMPIYWNIRIENKKGEPTATYLGVSFDIRTHKRITCGNNFLFTILEARH